MDADFLLGDAVADGVDRVARHAERDGLLPVCEAAVAVGEGCQAHLIGVNQHTLLGDGRTHTQAAETTQVRWMCVCGRDGGRRKDVRMSGAGGR